MKRIKIKQASKQALCASVAASVPCDAPFHLDTMGTVRRLPRGFRDPGPGPGHYRVAHAHRQNESKATELSIPGAERRTTLGYSDTGNPNDGRSITPGPGTYATALAAVSSSINSPGTPLLYSRPRPMVKLGGTPPDTLVESWTLPQKDRFGVGVKSRTMRHSPKKTRRTTSGTITSRRGKSAQLRQSKRDETQQIPPGGKPNIEQKRSTAEIVSSESVPPPNIVALNDELLVSLQSSEFTVAGCPIAGLKCESRHRSSMQHGHSRKSRELLQFNIRHARKASPPSIYTT
jgi:hypothetical protein